MFEQFVIIPGNEYVLFQALTKKSEEALDAEYGEFGLYGEFSSNEPFLSKLPNTSSVDTCINLKFLFL